MAIRKRVMRKNAALLPWLRAVSFAVLVLVGLNALSFYPRILPPVLALGAAALTLFVPAIAVLAVIVILALPLMAADLGIGIAFLLIGLSASQYLGQENARVFLVIGFAFAASLSGSGWALVVIAGYAFGASEGAVAVFLACLAIEGIGLVFGRETIGVLATGGTPPGLVSLAETAPGMVEIAGKAYPALGFQWLVPAFGDMDVPALVKGLTTFRDLPLLIGQPIIWAITACVTSSLTKPTDRPKHRMMGFVSVAVGTATVLGASAAMMRVTGGPVSLGTMATAALPALFISLGYVALSEFVFVPEVVEARQLGSSSLHAEDADVDELLRVISSAEDALAAKHTLDATILITDMKSFSAMTELDGSVLTAKVIQRHRDLLLPIIARHGGSGKSTGGDGLLATFERSGDAVAAAGDMQRALEPFHAEHPNERTTSIRVGVADGEVVVDRHGRPFIGDALNKAARIMSLADGGQIYATGQVMDKTPAPPPTKDHGPYKVKNIAIPLRVVEILWREGQRPKSPRGDATARAEEAPPPEPGGGR